MFDNINDLLTEYKNKIVDKITKNIGRPKKEEKLKKEKRVVSYLTNEEMDKFTQISEELDITVSQLVRKAILKYIKDSRK